MKICVIIVIYYGDLIAAIIWPFAGLSISCPNPTIICCATSCAFCTTYPGGPRTISCRPPTWVCASDHPFCGQTRRPRVRPKTCAPYQHLSSYSLPTVSCCAGHTCQICWATPAIPGLKNLIVSIYFSVFRAHVCVTEGVDDNDQTDIINSYKPKSHLALTDTNSIRLTSKMTTYYSYWKRLGSYKYIIFVIWVHNNL